MKLCIQIRKCVYRLIGAEVDNNAVFHFCYAVVAGITAKKVKEHPKDLRYEFQSKTCRL